MKVVISNNNGREVASTADSVRVLGAEKGMTTDVALRELGFSPKRMPNSFWRAIRRQPKPEGTFIVSAPTVEAKPNTKNSPEDRPLATASLPAVTQALRLNASEFVLQRNCREADITRLKDFLEGGRFHVLYTEVGKREKSYEGNVQVIGGSAGPWRIEVNYVDHGLWTDWGQLRFLRLGADSRH